MRIGSLIDRHHHFVRGKEKISSRRLNNETKDKNNMDISFHFLKPTDLTFDVMVRHDLVIKHFVLQKT